MSAFKIDPGVPVPKAYQNGLAEVLRSMKVGDSFLAPRRVTNFTPMVPKKYTCRAVEGGFRVWRTA